MLLLPGHIELRQLLTTPELPQMASCGREHELEETGSLRAGTGLGGEGREWHGAGTGTGGRQGRQEVVIMPLPPVTTFPTRAVRESNLRHPSSN